MIENLPTDWREATLPWCLQAVGGPVPVVLRNGRFVSAIALASSPCMDFWPGKELLSGRDVYFDSAWNNPEPEIVIACDKRCRAGQRYQCAAGSLARERALKTAADGLGFHYGIFG